ncbi:uncharacterized protein ACR2FA_008162 [Aphomia sociella]
MRVKVKFDEEYYSLPPLFQLDDYDECLSRSDGLYCLGKFHLTSEKQNHLYELMQEYSKDPSHYNHTNLHRGYCVSARCPQSPVERNASLRFERCVQQWARNRSLHSELRELHYCHSHEDAISSKRLADMDTPQLIFLIIVGVFIVLNAIGTIYDAVVDDEKKKSKLLRAWSVTANWQRLTSDRVNADPRLAALLPLEGVRVAMLAIVMWVHAGFIHYMLYVHNPRDLEMMMQNPLMIIVKNGTALVQVFVMLTSFLFAYNMLIYSKTHTVTFRILPKCIFHRFISWKSTSFYRRVEKFNFPIIIHATTMNPIIMSGEAHAASEEDRLTPVHLLVVGFAATWWPHIRGGPMWPMAVEAESALCRRKFWTHAVYVHNLVEPDELCVLPTWFLAVDMQLYIVAVILTLALLRLGRHAVPVLAVMFLGSCLLNAGLAYVFQWKSLLYIMNPENLFTRFRGISSFNHFYIAPWSSLSSCILGLLLANLHFQLEEKGFNAREHKWLVWLYQLYIPLAVGFIFTGYFFQQYTSLLVTTIHAGIERPVFVVLSAIFFLGIFNKLESCAAWLWWWRVWRAPARLSLSALALHWGAAAALTAAAARPLDAGDLDIIVDWLATMAITYLLSVPVTILVEIPMQRFFTALIS